MHKLSTTEQRFRDSIPDELAGGRDWVAWKAVRKPDADKLDKRPVKPNPLKFSFADSTDPDTWGTLEWAWQAMEAHELAGVGKVLHDGSDLIGIDLDDCRNKESGKVEPWAENIVERFATYAEVSPSRTGIKLWLYGTLPGARNKNSALGIEIYRTERFFTVTGEKLPDAPRSVNRPDPELLDAFYYSVFRDEAELGGKAATKSTGRQSPPLEDGRVLARLRSDKGAAKFVGAYDEGDITEWHGDDSKADWYLAKRIAFYTQDPEQVERIFDGSALARREKWTERPDYRERTIRGAIASLKEVWSPSENGDDPDKLDEQEYRDLFLSGAEGRLVRGLGGYLEYKEGYWLRGDAMLAERHAQETLTEIGAKVVVSKVDRMVRLARPYLTVPDDRWDREPYKLVLKNGTLDLLTGRLGPHEPAHHITAAVPYAFDPDAEGPNWDVVTGHVKDRLGGDVHGFLQEFYGYALTADTSHELMVFLTGAQGSGKSTFEVGGETMLGPMLYTALSLKRIQERFARAKVVGKRLIVSPELPAMYLFETEVIDALISGETIGIEEKHKPLYDYAPVAKVIQACNDLPVVPNPRQGFNRRVAIVEFPALPEEDRRKDLKAAIRSEGPYILNWALEGWARLRERGEFDIPGAVEAATDKWKQDNDTVGAFVSECLTEGRETVRRARVLELYSRWCETNNLKPLGRRKFYESFTKTPFHRQHHAVGDGYDLLKEIDLTDDGHHLNDKGYRPAINFAEI